MNLHSIRLELLLQNDIDTVAAIEANIAADPWTARMIGDSLMTGHQGWLLVGNEGEVRHILAYALLLVTPPEAELLLFGVPRHRQRQGWGHRLLHALCSNLTINGISDFFLEVRPSNIAARALYSRFAFAHSGMRKGYYPPTPAFPVRENALVLHRVLPGPIIDEA